jgi:hypothetical protein
MKDTEKLELIIDMLDRVEGTALYNIQKKLYGYTDQQYWEAVEFITTMYLVLVSKENENS